MAWGKKYFTGYRGPEVWVELGMVGDRLAFTTDETITKLGLGFIKNQSVECAMDLALRFTLLNAGENGEINAKQMLNQHTRLAALVERGLVADGWYLDNDGKKQRGWVFHQDGIRLFWNQIASSYDYTDTHFPAGILGARELWQYDRGYSGRSWRLQSHGYEHRSDFKKIWESEDGFYTLPLRGNERMAMNLLEDKEVLKCINQSLNRMVKSGKAIQVTSGRGRTFRWNAWGWLDEYRQKHLVSMAKQRKLGDVVNGWEFTKGTVQNLHGVEICNHEWQPVKPVQSYSINMSVPSWMDYSGYTFNESGIGRNSVSLPYLFFSMEDAEEALEHFKRLPTTGASLKSNGLPVVPTYTISKNDVTMRVKGEVMIEDYFSPQEMYKRMQLADESMFIELNNLLLNNMPKIAGNQTQQEE